MLADALISAMKEKLNDEFDQETIDAWEKWFYFLSNLLIERERDHYSGKKSLFPEGG